MSIAQRLQRLEAKLGEKRSWLTVFKLEDGSTFTTPDDPINYLMVNGIETPKGKITDYIPPGKVEKYDPISISIVEYIHELIVKDILSHPAPDRDIHDFE